GADRLGARLRGWQVLLPRLAGSPARRLGRRRSDVWTISRRRRAPAVRDRRTYATDRAASPHGQSAYRCAGGERLAGFIGVEWRAMIRLTQLTKRYGSFTAVNGINLEVPRGELFGFLGPNGAGKTTTLRMIAGILRPTSGRVEIGGIDLAADPIGAKTKLGFIPDRPFIYEKLTGAEFLRFVAGLYDQEGAVVEHRARELLALFDLEEWRDELVESYSHGMRQKLII